MPGERDQDGAGWRPIASAPLDGGPLLLFCPGINDWNRPSGIGEMVVGIWEWDWFDSRRGKRDRGKWVSDVGDVDQGYESTGAYFERATLHPTHWMPLPPPPDDEALRHAG